MKFQGFCHILLAFDIGFQIDLEKSASLIKGGSKRISIQPKHRAPKHFEFSSKPLLINHELSALKIAGYETSNTVDTLLFDFGAVSLSYRIPFEASLDQLVDLSYELYDNQEIFCDAENRIKELFETIRAAISKPLISELVEDYLIFEVKRGPHSPPPSELFDFNQQRIGQILKSERDVLSKQEITDALSEDIQYTPDDSIIVNWNAALIYGYQDDAYDVRAILESANVQLLELRFLDSKLDSALDEAYKILTESNKNKFLLSQATDHSLKRISTLQVDGALLFEGISNALKLLSDQHLARVYRLVGKKLYFADWDKGIARKLSALESIYEKLSDKISSDRMELLEVVIIILIVISILLPFITGVSH